MNKLNEQGSLLTSFYTRNGRMPSYGEAMKLFGYKSKDSAFKCIQKLVGKGYVKKDSKGKLVPIKVPTKSAVPSPITSLYTHAQKSIKILGHVEAGFPTPSEETDLDEITLDEWMIRDKDKSFMLKVKGDSMIDAGIQPGDYVIVERTNMAPSGSIVISEIDGSWTMKFLRKDKAGYYLEAANPKYKILRPESALTISAVVIGVVRKYI